MKTRSLRIAAVLFCLCSFGPVIEPAWAHRVNVFAWVEGDTIYVQSKFAGGKKVTAGQIVVMDPQGNELLSGLTDDQGEFSFKIPQATDLKVVLIAGQGHRGEWTIRAAEMQASPSMTAPVRSTAASGLPESDKTVSAKPAATQTSPPPGTVNRNELEAIVEAVLDKKLQPITRMLADARQSGPTVGDIMAGIGYILGLVGIAAYVQSRKKKA